MPKKDCPKCSGSGWMSVEGELGSYAERCDVCHPRSPHQKLLDAGVPPLEVGILGEPVDEQVDRVSGEVLEFCRGEMPDSLLVVGDPGRGKTVLGVRALDAASKAHPEWRVSYVYVPKWLSRLRDSFGQEGVTERQEMAPVLEPDLLLLDDLGVDHLTDWVKSVLTLAVNERLVQLRRTIVTSNYGLDAIRRLYGERLASRLGAYRLVPLKGDDLREKYKRLRIEAARASRGKGVAA